jgi:hypothetical protein
MAGIGEALKKSVLGAKEEELIKAGTMVVTRGIGIIALGLIGTFWLLDALGDRGPWAGMDLWQKIVFVAVAAGVWSIVAAADAIARGLATARATDVVAALPPGLKATVTTGLDSPGWSVVAVRLVEGKESESLKYLVVKESEPATWMSPDDLKFS